MPYMPFLCPDLLEAGQGKRRYIGLFLPLENSKLMKSLGDSCFPKWAESAPNRQKGLKTTARSKCRCFPPVFQARAVFGKQESVNDFISLLFSCCFPLFSLIRWKTGKLELNNFGGRSLLTLS